VTRSLALPVPPSAHPAAPAPPASPTTAAAAARPDDDHLRLLDMIFQPSGPGKILVDCQRHRFGHVRNQSQASGNRDGGHGGAAQRTPQQTTAIQRFHLPLLLCLSLTNLALVTFAKSFLVRKTNRKTDNIVRAKKQDLTNAVRHAIHYLAHGADCNVHQVVRLEC
jgi:hypothetical protein